MKLVLNNHEDSMISFVLFNRQLELLDPTVDYILYIDLGTTIVPTNAVYIARYAKEPIEALTIYDDNDVEIMALTDIDAEITSFGETLSNTGYNGSMAIKIKAPVSEEKEI